MKKRFGFTLAEILIVILVLGVLAAITVPIMIQSSRDTANVSAWKKGFTILKSLWDKVVMDAGGDATDVFVSLNDYYKEFESKLNIMKSCNSDSVSQGCFVSNSNLPAGLSPNGKPGFILGDGSAIFVADMKQDCSLQAGSLTYCARVVVDVNAKEGPNKVGRDIFVTYLKPDEIAPSGAGDGETCQNDEGMGCAAEILLNSSMIYGKN